MRRALTTFVLFLAILILTFPAVGPQVGSADSSPTTWTIMVYMAGNANPELPWNQNLNQMEAASQASGTNILALVDPFGGGNTTLYKVAHDAAGLNSVIVSPRVDDGGAIIPLSTNNSNMASPETLSSYVEFVTATYPADKYVLILWGHAADWYGLCPDGTDILTLPELRGALANATAVLGRPLDLVGVDACAEARLEMFFEIHDYTKYFVGSEMDIPSQGLPYRQIFDALADDVNVSEAALGTTIAKEYIKWSRNNSFYSATMAVFDLSKMQAFSDMFDSWVALGMRYEGLFHSEIQASFNSSEHYEKKWQIDFGSIAGHMLSSSAPIELRTRTTEVMEAFLQFRTYSSSFDNPDAINGTRAREPTGAVVYCPNTDSADRSYVGLQIASSGWPQYSHMLRRTASSNASVNLPSMSFGKFQDFGLGLFDTIILNWPSTYPLLDVWVFREQSNGLVFCGEFTGSGDNITIHDLAAIGNLVISASAGSMNTAVSYQRFDAVPITGEIRINVTLNGTTGEDNNIRLVLETSTGTIFINTTDPGDHVIRITLLTPRDVEIGDSVLIDVALGERLNGTGTAVLNSTTANVTIELSEIPSSLPGWVPITAMAVLAIGLIAIFAVLLQRENKRKRT